ncbi:MAG: RNA polymerase-associated protein RapA [Pseudomonadota bacterium]
MTDFKIGQKWISNAEPELGMGRVLRLEHRTVSLYFDAAAEERNYARAEAPLTRVRFNPGDRIATLDEITITVTRVVDQNGIFVYHGDYQGTNTAVMETELDANVRFSKPEDRLFTHQIDANHWFNLRVQSRNSLATLSRATSRGLYGPRVALIPHQLYIGAEVARRFAPRVLLADEVGLGKTIEAGLILHQRIQSGRASRVLLVVPPALTFQWFVEMIRRFNLQFTVMDDNRCEQIVADNTPEDIENDNLAFNPFEAQQLCLASLDLFTEHPDRITQAVAAEWDLIVVDEAHHLRWSETNASPEYLAVERLSRASRGLLLLTATPEQLGRAGHFARLRLLDPDRFHDYGTFVAEDAQFERVVQAVNQLITGNSAEQTQARGSIRHLLAASEEMSDSQLIEELLDRHGTGRVLFRNVRSSVLGFPERVPLPVSLPLPAAYQGTSSLTPEEAVADWVNVDPRVAWLRELLQRQPADKFLVICARQQTARELEAFISSTTGIRAAVFHEGLDLVARDRAAAWFAETERGAQVLVASEIGSEGRNFQFASHLVLFDLPAGPDLLEQRIGRLDRIGQQFPVKIHIPYVDGTPQARLYRFYADGVGVFREPNPVAQGLFDEYAGKIMTGDLDQLIPAITDENRQRREAVNRGRDRLLELNSHRPAISAKLLADIEANEGGTLLADYMESAFDAWGLESEPLGDQVFLVKPTERMVRHASTSVETWGHYHFPELPEDGIRITYNRNTALAREDVLFFTWESPTVQQALDLAISDITGNSTMIAVRHPQLPAGILLVEAIHIVDCVAPKALGADRFLPPLVLRALIAPDLTDLSGQLPYSSFAAELLDVNTTTLHTLIDSQGSGIRAMLTHAGSLAAAQLGRLRDSAMLDVRQQFEQEIRRLAALQQVNPLVRPEEIDHLANVRDDIILAIERADVRLDAVRVIVAA